MSRHLGVIDRYLIGLAGKPLALSLGVVLAALLLERVLRLVDMLSATGGTPYWLLVALTASLVPHYVSLALTAAFFVAVFVAMSRLGDGSELDALMASGVSIRRICMPFVALGCVLMVVSVILYGFLNPVTRYDYHRLLYTAAAGWDAKVPPATFIDAGHGITITADRVDTSGRRLTGVFIQRKRPSGTEITSARTGTLELSKDQKHLTLLLQDGITIRDAQSGATGTLRFKNLTYGTQFNLDLTTYRARGESERELTMPELVERIASGDGDLKPAALKAELADRLVRALTLPLLPLLAVPLSFAGRRGSRTTGLVFAAIVLVTFNNALQFATDLGASRATYTTPIVVAPFVVFAALCIWLFQSSKDQPVEAPIVRMVSGLQTGITAFAGRITGLGRTA
ncbi:LptF/LptG family permease [Pararhizobium mangrovi]|nr:LptF/LptG family permease [Pararhizobium mangrovi]